jgi:peptide/nickel transport system permease protein
MTQNTRLLDSLRGRSPSTSWFMRLRTASFGNRLVLACFAAITIIALAGPLLAPHSATIPSGTPFAPPQYRFPFGTDEVGRDILSRTLYGAQRSWLAALAVIASGVFIGGLVGLVAGALGGWVDMILMRITDAFLALPAAILAIAVAAALGPSFTHTLVAVAIVWWPYYARMVRGEIRALAVRPNVEAARLAGVKRLRLWRRHLLPGVIPVIVVAASLDVGALVLTLAGLSFLGLGSPEPAPELGAMAAQGLQYQLSAWWIPVLPAIALFVLAAAGNLGGDAVRSLLRNR